jgi:hypothetical protein
MTTTSPPALTRAQPPARFRDLIAAEWIKIRSLRSTFWTLAVTALVVIAAAVNVHRLLAGVRGVAGRRHCPRSHRGAAP